MIKPYNCIWGYLATMISVVGVKRMNDESMKIIDIIYCCVMIENKIIGNALTNSQHIHRREKSQKKQPYPAMSRLHMSHSQEISVSCHRDWIYIYICIYIIYIYMYSFIYLFISMYVFKYLYRNIFTYKYLNACTYV